MIVRGPEGPDGSLVWTLRQRYVRLRGRHRLEFSFFHRYTLVPPSIPSGQWRPTTIAYFYQLREQNGPEVILFHWHPFPGQVQFPHLHMAGGAGSIAIDSRRHIPTGPLSLHAVVRFAIAELGVRPLRPDWEPIVEEGASQASA